MSEAQVIAIARTFLFVPGTRPDRFAKAASSGADAIVLDLEDAVAPELKTEARENVRRWRASGGQGLVRINDSTTPWYDQDVMALGDHPCVVMLPKVADVSQILALVGALSPGSGIVPLIETAAGVLDARTICSVPGVVRVAFGNGDLSAELGVDYRSYHALVHARSEIVLASAASGIAGPIDGVTTAFNDDDALLDDTRHAAELGFTGKMCIHPRQVAIAQHAFGPTEAHLQWAQRVLSASQKEQPATVDGEMIDGPIIDIARATICRSAVTNDR